MFFDFSDLERVFDGFVTAQKNVINEKENKESNKAKYNMFSYDDEFTIQIVAPGCSKNCFSIEINDDMLTVEMNCDNPSIGDYSVKQYSVDTYFKNEFKLNVNELDVDSVKSSYENGLLNIVFDKSKKAKNIIVKVQ